ncbi:hypothetical protein CEXT_796151 [Caerostris extrusa]|uniref:Uncharacterized protein n=1 Tax=Caerostris extrusa TaxID=172846 RepID=A0AAV4SZF5_CAEEX|nr:hypothetical protein CEXT_796151 [Caerostris extrusa]
MDTVPMEFTGMMPRVFILGGLHVESDDTLVRAAEPEPRSPWGSSKKMGMEYSCGLFASAAQLDIAAEYNNNY